jgi:hypothetical protein
MQQAKSNIENELLSTRRKAIAEAQIIEQVRQLLANHELERLAIREKIDSGNTVVSNAFNPELLETDKIFHLTQIRQICIDYRLRFLDTHYFKNGIPEEAVSKINHLEKLHNTELHGFKIMAPTKAFQLLSYDDPLLFAPIGNDYYYLIHQWGNDISPTRKWIVKPYKNLLNFVLFCLLISVVLTAFVPENNLSKTVPMATIIIFLFMFKSIVAVLMYGFFMMGKNFNTAIWDREYFNN